MHEWQTRVIRHLGVRRLSLPPEVVDELAGHLEDLWEARAAGGDDDRDRFAEEALRRADLPSLAARRRPAPLPPAPEPAAGGWFAGLGRETLHASRLLARAPRLPAPGVGGPAPG